MTLLRLLCTPFAALVGVFSLISLAHAGLVIEFKDPAGDDKGPGNYKYPTKGDYRKGDFDITSVKIEDKGDTVEFRVTVKNRIRDVWNSRSWGGNGFSVQFAQIYIRNADQGHQEGLPGLNIRFAKGHHWNKVVLLSPQGTTRLRSEINLKAEKFKKDVVIPTSTSASGKTISAVVSKKSLGGSLNKSWGFQVIMQSNEGFPRKTDLLTRPVNEYEGEHRFGGGHDGDCDPHVIDLLAGKAQGDASEKKAQFKMLSYSCEGKGKPAEIQMVTAP
jgi:carbohydrate-binding DOMON domain-containing protein